MSDIPAQEPADRAASASLGELLGEVSRDLSTLFRQEVELAKAELKESATRAGRASGMLSGAGLAGIFAIQFVSIAIWWALGDLIGLGWSAVIVAVLWALVALFLYLRGRKELKTVRGMPETADSVKKIPETIKEARER